MLALPSVAHGKLNSEPTGLFFFRNTDISKATNAATLLHPAVKAAAFLETRIVLMCH